MSESSPPLAKLRKWFPTAGHFLLFARVAAWALVLPLLVRFRSLPSLMALLTPDRESALLDLTPTARAELVKTYVIVVLRQNPRNSGRMCLKRSLLLYRFLRLVGLPAVFYLGVRKEGDRLAGHSWIEIEGERFGDPLAHESFFVSFVYPGIRPRDRKPGPGRDDKETD